MDKKMMLEVKEREFVQAAKDFEDALTTSGASIVEILGSTERLGRKAIEKGNEIIKLINSNG